MHGEFCPQVGARGLGLQGAMVGDQVVGRGVEAKAATALLGGVAEGEELPLVRRRKATPGIADGEEDQGRGVALPLLLVRIGSDLAFRGLSGLDKKIHGSWIFDPVAGIEDFKANDVACPIVVYDNSWSDFIRLLHQGVVENNGQHILFVIVVCFHNVLQYFSILLVL